jgi:dihydrofolate reductase
MAEVPSTQYYCAASLDGFIADADDGIGWLTGYEGTFEGEGLEPGPMADGGSYSRFYHGIGALVSGSVTYEFVLGHTAEGAPWPYAGKPYWVLSSRDLPLPQAEGADVRVANADPADLHEEMLAAADGGNLWVVGGGGVASRLADAGLLDEVLVTIVPVVLGAGKPVFSDPVPGAPLRLLGTEVYGNGMVELRYELARGTDRGPTTAHG